MNHLFLHRSFLSSYYLRKSIITVHELPFSKLGLCALEELKQLTAVAQETFFQDFTTSFTWGKGLPDAGNKFQILICRDGMVFAQPRNLQYLGWVPSAELCCILSLHFDDKKCWDFVQCWDLRKEYNFGLGETTCVKLSFLIFDPLGKKTLVFRLPPSPSPHVFTWKTYGRNVGPSGDSAKVLYLLERLLSQSI